MSIDHVPEQSELPAPEALVHCHASAVLGLCLVYARNLHDAEDLMQESLLRAIKHLRHLRDPQRARWWVLQIARRTCISHYRGRKTPARLPEDLPAPQVSVDPRLERLRAALAKLPEPYRETISIFYLDGRSCEGVAEALGISEGAVRVRLTRGRWMLHELLKEAEA